MNQQKPEIVRESESELISKPIQNGFFIVPKLYIKYPNLKMSYVKIHNSSSFFFT